MDWYWSNGIRGAIVNATTVNSFIDAALDNLSTFSVDVDTASYTMARGSILSGELPDYDSIRVEEFINYFQYNYPEPEDEAEGDKRDVSEAEQEKARRAGGGQTTQDAAAEALKKFFGARR